MLPDRVSNPGPLTYESGALPIALRGPAATHGSTPNSLTEGIKLKSSQHQVPCIVILSILIKYLEQNVCACVTFILSCISHVTLYKR